MRYRTGPWNEETVNIRAHKDQNHRTTYRVEAGRLVDRPERVVDGEEDCWGAGEEAVARVPLRVRFADIKDRTKGGSATMKTVLKETSQR
jgi:hypothetical protein